MDTMRPFPHGHLRGSELARLAGNDTQIPDSDIHGPLSIQEVLARLASGAVKSPMGLSEQPKAHAFALDQAVHGSGLIDLLWQCAKCHFEFPTGRAAQRFHRDSDAIPRLLGEIHGMLLQDTQTFKDYSRLRRDLGRPGDFDLWAPGERSSYCAPSPTGRASCASS